MKFCPACQRQYAITQRLCLEDGTLLSLRDPYNLVGRTLVEKYRLEALVGIGGMGAVYSAHHLGIDRHVAVKILQPNIAVGNERVLELFEREAKMAGHLTHDNIANVMDAGRTGDGLAYIAMEWLEGRTLEEEILLNGRFSFERAGQILTQVAVALDVAHAHRIVHRDLKPANIMLVKRAEWGEDGPPMVKVLDFGIAKVVSETTAAAVSAPMGTPHYASPEQFRTGGHIDGRSDIYSLGVVLFRMLTDEVPFATPSLHHLVQRQLNEPPPLLRSLRPDSPEALEQLLSRLLAKNPDERPQHAREIGELYFHAIGAPSDFVTAVTTPWMRSQWSTAKFEGPTLIDAPRSTSRNAGAATRYLTARRSRPIVAGLVLVSLVVAAFIYWQFRASRAVDRTRISFATFENLSSDRELDSLERIVPELLLAKLAAVHGLTITGSGQMSDALVALGKRPGDRLDSKTVHEAARRAGAGAAVLGSITKNGSRMQLAMRIEDVTRGTVFFTDAVEGSRSEDVFEMIDSLAAKIAVAYGLTVTGAPRVADLTTRSYEALRFYQTGYDRLLAHDFAGASRNLENATKIDPNYALAHLQLGRAYKLAGNRAGAKDAFAKAMGLRDRVGENDRLMIEGYYQLISQNDKAKASESFEQVLVRYPRDKEALLALTDIYRDLKQYDRSIECGRRALAIDARFGAVWNAVGYSHLLKHDYVNAIDAFKRYGEAEPGNPNPYDSLGDTYTEAGLYDEAIAAYQRSFEIQPDFYGYSALWKKAEVYFLKGDDSQATANAEQFLRNTTDRNRRLGELTLARVELYHGRLSRARDHFTQARKASQRADDKSLEADSMIRETSLLAGVRQYDKASRLINEVHSLTPQSRSWIGASLLTLALSGKTAQAQQEYVALGLKTPSALDFELRARDAQSRGDFATAISLWKNLREQMPAVPRNYDLALAYIGSGQAGDAERELREFLKARPVPDLGSSSPINPLYDTRYILAHYELGRACDMLNKREAAEESYRKFLDFWGAADFELTEIKTAKQRLAER